MDKLLPRLKYLLLVVSLWFFVHGASGSVGGCTGQASAKFFAVKGLVVIDGIVVVNLTSGSATITGIKVKTTDGDVITIAKIQIYVDRDGNKKPDETEVLDSITWENQQQGSDSLDMGQISGTWNTSEDPPPRFHAEVETQGGHKIEIDKGMRSLGP